MATQSVPINQVIQVWAERLNLTNSEEEKEPYLLTPEEESHVIAHAISELKKERAYKMRKVGNLPETIDLALSKIDWEERLDKSELLATANSNKNYSIWQSQQREKERIEMAEKKDALIKKCSAKYFFNVMAWTSKNKFNTDLLVIPQNRHLIQAICFFLSKDKRFETELGYDLKKGIMIRGVSGLGKTFLFKCVQQNDLIPFQIISLNEISSVIKMEGHFELNTSSLLYLDDVGTENPVINHYGTKITFFKDFIENYYLNTSTYSDLIISTNINSDEIEEKYGFRVRSRMKDMFNVIDVEGQDMRGR